LRVRRGEALTLLCSTACVDPARCHRTLLAKLIEDAVTGAGADTANPTMLRRWCVVTSPRVKPRER